MITIGGATAVAVAAVSALFIGLDATTAAPAVRTPGAQMTLDQVVHDLAVKGLWPRQALEPAVADPESIIFGPAHPLGSPDIGIPCASRVFTRC